MFKNIKKIFVALIVWWNKWYEDEEDKKVPISRRSESYDEFMARHHDDHNHVH
jgi:hypothetical protein